MESKYHWGETPDPLDPLPTGVNIVEVLLDWSHRLHDEIESFQIQWLQSKHIPN